MTESLPPEDPRDALIRELSAQVAELTSLVVQLLGQFLDAASTDDLPGRKAPGQRKRGETGKWFAPVSLEAAMPAVLKRVPRV